jgi:anti-sigma regulatory factor (Ser/Thr protein kinase)
MPTLRVPASLAALDQVPAYAAGLAAAAAFTERDGYRLRLILEELVTNVATHAAVGPEPDWVEITGSAAPGQVRLRIVDHEDPFDPVAHPPPTQPPPDDPAPARPGGYGLVLVRAAADGFDYHRAGGDNITDVLVRHHDEEGNP